MTIERLLRVYPAAWRERYGAEFAALLEEGELSWRVQLDVIRGGLIQRARQSGVAGDDVPETERVRAGVLLVLSAWSVFVMAGCAFAKVTEHWQDVTPGGSRSAPTGAFSVLVLAAEIGTVAVLAGIAVSLSAFVTLLRTGGWPSIRRPIVRATRFSAVTVVVSGGLVVWAHHLTNAQRNGGNRLFGAVFVLWALFVFGSIALWTVAAVMAALRLRLTAARLRLEARIACATTFMMLVMTVAALVFWATVGSPASLQLSAITVTMLIASALAVAGSSRSLRASHRSS